MSRLTDIFTEALLSRLLPLAHEVTLPAMWSFGQPPLVALVAAGVGGVLAGMIYYAIGMLLRRMPTHVSNEAQLARIEKIRRVATAWLPWLLFLAPTPIGGALVLAAGFFAVNPLVAAWMVVFGEVAWRVSPWL